MERLLFSLPDQLVARLRVVIPAKHRSRVVTQLLEKEIEKRERKLYQCAVAVEKDSKLKKEMSEWDETLQDGLDNESW